MKLRLFTGLALALALGGCTTYGYVGDGGGYYTGAPVTQYRYSGYGYGYGGYGAPYYYSPGVSFGLSYGYPYRYYSGGPYRPPYYGGGYYYPRPPYHGPRPDHDHGRPDHDHDHDGRPGRPPVAEGTPPPLNRAPWRDLERMRRAQGDGDMPRRQPGPGTMGVGSIGPGPASGVAQPGLRPAPPPAYRVIRPGAPSGSDISARRASAEPRAQRMESTAPRSTPRSSGARRAEQTRTATPDTIEP